MKVSKVASKTEVIEYESLTEFYDYICKTPFNNAFRWEEHKSVTGNRWFTKTANFEEATKLFKEGWSDMATKLTQKLKVIENKTEPTMKPRNTLGVAGYQAIVPLYLQGVPTNMVTKKMIPIKQKVITINKSIDYSAGISSDTIIDESIKALQIIKKLEAQGYRCNLNIVLGSKSDKYTSYGFFVKIRIKSANEKLNVSKLAFPLVHPSMLRRLFFRFEEVYPNITKNFVSNYGYPATPDDLRTVFHDEYLLPQFISKDVNKINNINDLEKL